MPSAKTHTALNRQWELLKRLPKKLPGLTVKQLHDYLEANDYNVTRRTVERDLANLSLMFPLQSTEDLIAQQWYLMPKASFELEGLTVTEAVSLSLVEDAVRPLLPASMLNVLAPRFEHARNKLNELKEGHPGARLPYKVATVRADLNLQPPQINALILESIQEALINETQVRCRYYSAHSDKVSELTLNPLAMVQRGQITYLIATAAPFTDVRQYAVHRFHQAECLDSPCLDLEAFDLEHYLASDALQFGKPEKITLKAWISAHQARLLRETPLSEDMCLHEQDEGFMVHATVSDTWQLQWWILSQGDGLLIHEPPALRQKIAGLLQKAAAAYEQQNTVVCPA